MTNGRAFFNQLGAGVTALTVAAGILAAIVSGATMAAAVFIVGFAVLVPLLSVRPGHSPEAVERWLDVAERAEGRSDGRRSADPLETLRERYARGELDDREFEEQLERLVATDAIPDHAIRDRTAEADSTERTEDDTRRDAGIPSDAERERELGRSPR